MTLIHAITPHHRGPEILATCLESLVCSSGVDLHVVVVANGRDAEVPTVAEALEEVSVVSSEEPLGFSAANNLGIDWARRELGSPDYYLFVNNDVVVEPDMLERLVRAIDQTGAKVAGPLLLIEWARDYLNSLGLNVTEDAWGWDEGIGLTVAEYGPLPERREVLAVTGSALLIDAEELARVGGWTEIYDYYFEDIDLCLKVRRLGGTVVHEPLAVANHHISASVGLGSRRKNLLFWRNRLVLALVHWPLPRLLAVFGRGVFGEGIFGDRATRKLARQALAGALKLAPSALRIRRALPGDDRSWTRFLRPAGSVPVITLPQIAEPVDADAEGSGLAWVADLRPARPTIRGRSLRPAGLGPAAWRRARELCCGAGPPESSAKRVLVLGSSPLPFENERMNYAPGGRTWQFAAGLAADGHRICVACARIPGAHQRSLPRLVELTVEAGADIVAYTLEDGLFFDTDALDGLVRAFEPHVLVGASPRPSRRAVELAGRLPVWADVFGDLMAEGQALATVREDEVDILQAYRNLLVPILRRGDVFSTVSERQKYSLIGQLGLAGRLNRRTAGESLVSVVPCCAFEQKNVSGGDGDVASRWPGEFVVLWSGGFNTWCDVETLVAGLDEAMARAPDLRLVATGGAIAGHDETSFETFRRLVADSPHRERFVITGSVDRLEAESIAACADIGLITERRLYERELGSSGRIAAWLGRGLPVVCTTLSEIGEMVGVEGLGFVYRPGDAADLSRAVLEARANRNRLPEMAARARKIARRRFSPVSTTAPLRTWVDAAAPASDGGCWNSLDVWQEAQDLDELLASERLERDEERRQLENRFHSVRSELGEIHHSKMWRMWTACQSVWRVLRAPLGLLKR